MTFVILTGVLSAVAVIVIMSRIGMKKFAGYPALCDAAVTMLLAYLLFGTWSGMVAAIIGGLTFSVFLTIYRNLFGFSKLTKEGWKDFDYGIER